MRVTFRLGVAFRSVHIQKTHSMSSQLICRIDVSAFAGVMFVLVGMFIVISTPANICTGGVDVDLARARSGSPMQSALRADALNVAVLRDGSVFLRTQKVAVERLPEKIREALAEGAEKKVYIKADIRARYVTVKSVLDAVHASGVENIAFLTEQRRPPVAQ